jgi:hypothetical protein
MAYAVTQLKESLQHVLFDIGLIRLILPPSVKALSAEVLKKGIAVPVSIPL